MTGGGGLVAAAPGTSAVVRDRLAIAHVFGLGNSKWYLLPHFSTNSRHYRDHLAFKPPWV